MPGDEEGVKKALYDSYEALDAGDLERAMTFFTKDAFFDTREVEGIGGISQGEKAIRERCLMVWERFLKRKHFLKNISISVHQGQALVICDCIFHATTPNGGQMVKLVTNAYLWRREGGAWKIAWQKVRGNEAVEG